MRRLGITGVVAAVLLALVAVAGIATNSSSASAPPGVVSAFGARNVGGQELIVHVTLAVAEGADAEGAARDALARQGAAPLQSADYKLLGQWSQFSNGTAADDLVEQRKNFSPATGAPGGAAAALAAAQTTWSGVPKSNFAFSDVGGGLACPSLIPDCQGGSQSEDGHNDVSFADLGGVSGGSITLGVTWFVVDPSTATLVEADIALNENGAIDWGDNPGGIAIDLETVTLHELGHVVGLGHSPKWKAVMYASYDGAQTELDKDDENGVKFLYPAPADADPEPTPEPGSDWCSNHTYPHPAWEKKGCPVPDP